MATVLLGGPSLLSTVANLVLYRLIVFYKGDLMQGRDFLLSNTVFVFTLKLNGDIKMVKTYLCVFISHNKHVTL